MTADDLREIAAHHAQQEADIAEYAQREGLTPEQVRDSRWDPECVRDHADRAALLALVRQVADIDPLLGVGESYCADDHRCGICRAGYDRPERIRHAPDCLWVIAQGAK